MYRLHLLGGLTIEGPEGPLTGRVAQPRQLALLSVLGVARGKPVSRDRLIGLMWPETPDEKARRLLSDTVYVVRRALGSEVLLTVGDALQLRSDHLWWDVNAFEEALSENRLKDAVELYRGPFLDGFYVSGAHDFDRWMGGQRRRLAQRYGDTLEALAAESKDEGDLAAAIGWWKRRSALERTNSRVALRLAEALIAAGDHAGAVAHIRRHETLLRDDIGVGLPPEFESVLGALQRPTAKSALPQPPARPVGSPARLVQGETARVDENGSVAPAATSERNALLPATVAFLTILALGLLGWGIRSLGVSGGQNAASSIAASDAPPTPVASVAVLPFVKLDDQAEDYFAAGLTEDLRTRLARSPELAVINHTAGQWAQGDGRSAVEEVAERLGADYLVRGTVRRGPDVIYVTAELVDARSGRILWARTFDRPLGDLFLIQADLSSRIAGRLGASDAPGVAAGLGTSTPKKIEAYDLFLEARWLWHRSMHGQWVPTYPADADELRRMIELLERSIALDSTYAPAHALLGDLLLSWRLGIPPDSGLAALNRSLALDERLPVGHHFLARHKYLREGRIADARKDARRALELDPSYLPAIVSFAEMSDVAGALDEAFLWAQRAWTIAPNAPQWYRAEWVARVHWLTGSPELARPILQHLHEVDGGPRGRLALFRLAGVSLTEGRIDEARSYAEEFRSSGGAPVNSLNLLALIELHAGNWDAAIQHLEELLAFTEGRHDLSTVSWGILQMAPTNLGFAYVKVGRTEESEEMLARSVAFQEEALADGHVTVAHHFDLARVAAIRGDVARASSHLEKALADGWMYPYTFLGLEAPQFERVRDDQHFRELMETEKKRLDVIRRRLESMGLRDWTPEVLFQESRSRVR